MARRPAAEGLLAARQPVGRALVTSSSQVSPLFHAIGNDFREVSFQCPAPPRNSRCWHLSAPALQAILPRFLPPWGEELNGLIESLQQWNS